MEKENLYYLSTRKNEPKALSAQAIIKGIAEDGGLFVPEVIPRINSDFFQLLESKYDYKTIAYLIIKKFFTDFEKEEIVDCINHAYNQKFDAEAITPLIKKEGVYFLELFHGPTLSFKDLALSILPFLLTRAIQKLRINKEIVILTATSGDTGKAALQAFSGVRDTRIIVLYPLKGVSTIQERQMLTQEGDNVFVVGLEGNFDDAQRGIKEIFEDRVFNKRIEEKKFLFSSANSINIGRLIPQIVYYFYAYGKMLQDGEIENGEKINIVVPTGNFGNILAAYYAREMGLPINKLICASNENRVLADFFQGGTYDRRRELIPTISPSMDILISSNLERLLWHAAGKNFNQVKELMELLKSRGFYAVNHFIKDKLDIFYGEFANQQDCREGIKEVFSEWKYLIDPHTAVAWVVYKKYHQKTGDITKTIIVATASPFKFPKSVMESIDERNKKYTDFELIKKMSDLAEISIPLAIRELEKKPIQHHKICSCGEIKKTINEILNGFSHF